MGVHSNKMIPKHVLYSVERDNTLTRWLDGLGRFSARKHSLSVKYEILIRYLLISHI